MAVSLLPIAGDRLHLFPNLHVSSRLLQWC